MKKSIYTILVILLVFLLIFSLKNKEVVNKGFFKKNITDMKKNTDRLKNPFDRYINNIEDENLRNKFHHNINKNKDSSNKKTKEKSKYNLNFKNNYHDINSNNTSNMGAVNNKKNTIHPSTNLPNDTLENIIVNYAIDFLDLQNKYENKINILIKNAKNKYINKDLTIGNTYDYISRGKKLEKQCDNEVELLLNKMKKDLSNINEDTKIVEEIENYYYSKKSMEKDKIYKKYKDNLR